MVGVLVLVLGLLLPTLFTSVSRFVMVPVHSFEFWLRESPDTFPSYLRDRQELIKRIASLEEDLAIQNRTDFTEERLREENEQLRDLLGAGPDDKRIVAAVVARPGELPYDLIQIDRGSQDGIVVGAPVYTGSDTVIGVVVQVAPRYAFIQSFTSPGFSATAFISGADVIATLQGHGGGVARVRVPQGVSIEVGNLVHTPSLTPGVFGRIAYIENRPSQPEQYGYITLDKPLFSLRYVAVGTYAIEPATPEAINDTVQALIAGGMSVPSADLVSIGTSTPSNASSTLPNASSTDHESSE